MVEEKNRLNIGRDGYLLTRIVEAPDVVDQWYLKYEIPDEWVPKYLFRYCAYEGQVWTGGFGANQITRMIIGFESIKGYLHIYRRDTTQSYPEPEDKPIYLDYTIDATSEPEFNCYANPESYSLYDEISLGTMDDGVSYHFWMSHTDDVPVEFEDNTAFTEWFVANRGPQEGIGCGLFKVWVYSSSIYEYGYVRQENPPSI